ncbi:MAG: IPT/TIG domain-containing protein [Polyangiales bacterium]
MKRRNTRGACMLLAALSLFACEGSKEMQVTGINPQAGHIAGDQTVEIQGKNFRTDIGYTVYFGNAKATSVSIRSSEALVVTTPSGKSGPVDVTLRADDGIAYRMKQGFRYEDMGGSVVEGLGKSGEAKKKGNLAF